MSPRALIVVADIGSHQFMFVVAHVPDQGSDEPVGAFYDLLDSSILTIRNKFVHAMHISLFDANGRLGSYTSSAIGNHDCDIEDERGEALRLHLDQHALRATNTFFSCGHTRTHSSGKRSRIDYVLILDDPMCILNSVAVRNDIHLTLNERDDHFVVTAAFTTHPRSQHGGRDATTSSSPNPIPTRKPSIALMKSPDHIILFHRHLQTPFPYQFDLPVEFNLKAFVQHVKTAMTVFVDKSSKKPRK